MTRIFISYRRDDSQGQSGRLYDRLATEFGRDLLFMDVDAIPLGVNFVKVLREEVGKCDVLLAVIGPSWLHVKDEDGGRRLDKSHDPVRIEIGTALARDIPVIPILLDGTRMPKPADLPDELRELSLRNGLDVRHASFHADMEKLVRGLKGIGGNSAPASSAPAPPQAHPAGAIQISVRTGRTDTRRWIVPGGGRDETNVFHDEGIDAKGRAVHGPDMVVVPAGRFTMGSPKDEPERSDDEGRTDGRPHVVTIDRPFAIGRFAVTRGEFAAFESATSHKVPDAAWTFEDGKFEERQGRSWKNPGFAQDDTHPVVCINWQDAEAYTAWLKDTTGGDYRLPSEAEWEYAARCVKTAEAPRTPFWWGKDITTERANYNGNYAYAGGAKSGKYRKATVPVRSFEANPWGLWQAHGNTWEWCGDCWNTSLNATPTDTLSATTGDCSFRVVRGGSWLNLPRDARSASRLRAHSRNSSCGLRLARTLPF